MMNNNNGEEFFTLFRVFEGKIEIIIKTHGAREVKASLLLYVPETERMKKNV